MVHFCEFFVNQFTKILGSAAVFFTVVQSKQQQKFDSLIKVSLQNENL